MLRFEPNHEINWYLFLLPSLWAVVSSRGAPTPAGTSVFTKHNWGINHLMGGAFMGIVT